MPNDDGVLETRAASSINSDWNDKEYAKEEKDTPQYEETEYPEEIQDEGPLSPGSDRIIASEEANRAVSNETDSYGDAL